MLISRFVSQNTSSWNLLITEYIRGGKLHHGLALYKELPPDTCARALDGSTYVCLLKACAHLRDLEMGQQIHETISATTDLLEKDIFIGSSLVNMYAKCNALAKAQEVLDMLPARNVVSWTALMSGYGEHGHSEDALACLEGMQEEGIAPNIFSYICILKSCSHIRAVDKARRVHSEVVKKGWEREEFFCNALVDTYSKCCSLASAQHIFDGLPRQDVVSWTALIAGYVECENAEVALSLAEKMNDQGIPSNSFTYVCILKACASLGAISRGQEIHSQVLHMGLESELLIGSALVNLYTKCAMLTEAEDVFNNVPFRDFVLWTTLIGGYAEHGYGEKALRLFRKMQSEGHPVNAVSLICGLKSCGDSGATHMGQEIHTDIVSKGFEGDLFVGNSLVDMYAELGLLATAEEVLNKLPVQDIVAWNALLAGYVEYGSDEEALIFFEKFQGSSAPFNAASFVCSLKFCGRLGDAGRGRDIHTKLLSAGFGNEPIIGSTLVDMYIKCQYFAEALELFKALRSHDVVAWTALISGYIDYGHGREALYVLNQMEHEGVCLNAVSFVCILRACSCERAIVKGREIHAVVIRRGLEREPFVGNTLVDMYTKCGTLAEAHEVFNRLPEHDTVSGMALMAGYADHGHGEDALQCLELLQQEGIPLNAVAIGCSLKVCGQLGALFKGQQMHDELVRKEFEGEEMSRYLLVDMYARCASLGDALHIFAELNTRDIESWNALIAGFAQVVESETVVCALETMVQEGVQPDSTTFACVLNTCSDAGLIDMARACLEVMGNEFGVTTDPDHYTCVVDMFGRVGQIERAVAIIEYAPLHPRAVMWHTVLGACRKIGNVELGRLAFEHAASLDQKSIAAHVHMCNLYAEAAFEDTEEV